MSNTALCTIDSSCATTLQPIQIFLQRRIVLPNVRGRLPGRLLLAVPFPHDEVLLRAALFAVIEDVVDDVVLVCLVTVAIGLLTCDMRYLG